MARRSNLSNLRFEEDGAVLQSAALSVFEIELLEKIAGKQDAAAPGARLIGDADLRLLLSSENSPSKLVQELMGETANPVRAVLFNKSPERNWGLGWHQDRTIVVQERIETDGFGSWTSKRGLQHVEPPFEFFERMVTLRIHLDDVDENNAPLKIALGSHSQKRIPVENIVKTVLLHKQAECLAVAGDIWAYKTPILHASDPSKSLKNRRVLQVDYCSAQLPNGLKWQGI